MYIRLSNRVIDFPVLVRISALKKLYKPTEIRFWTSVIGKNMSCLLAKVAR